MLQQEKEKPRVWDFYSDCVVDSREIILAPVNPHFSSGVGVLNDRRTNPFLDYSCWMPPNQ